MSVAEKLARAAADFRATGEYVGLWQAIAALVPEPDEGCAARAGAEG